MLASSGFIIHVDGGKCNGCGICVTTCTFNALGIDGGKLMTIPEACMGCGVCVDKCARQALSLQPAPQRGQPLEIMKLLEEYNVS